MPEERFNVERGDEGPVKQVAVRGYVRGCSLWSLRGLAVLINNCTGVGRSLGSVAREVVFASDEAGACIEESVFFSQQANGVAI